MISALALLLAAASPEAQALTLEIEERTAICREGLARWDIGDRDWTEREMARRGLSSRARQTQRMVCAVYLQGVLDVAQAARAQEAREAQGARNGESLRPPQIRARRD